MPRARFGIALDGALLDADNVTEWDPASATWRATGRSVGEYFEARSITDDEATRMIAPSTLPASIRPDRRNTSSHPAAERPTSA